jgi:hypothetical protein
MSRLDQSAADGVGGESKNLQRCSADERFLSLSSKHHRDRRTLVSQAHPYIANPAADPTAVA